MAQWTLINSFEDDDINDWNNLDGYINQTSTGDSEGIYAGEPKGTYNQLAAASLNVNLANNKPSKAKFTYEETSNAQDHGIAFYDGNGNLLVGAGSDNPQHEYINYQGDVSRTSSEDGAYDEITTVTFTFDWSNNNVDIDWSSSSSSGSASDYLPNNGIEELRIGSIEGSGDPTNSFYDAIEMTDQVAAPSRPENPSITIDANDQITFDWDNPSDWGGESGNYRMQMKRDGISWEYASGGPNTLNDDGSASYSATYGPNSDNAYKTQVGIDSTFRFRVRAENSAGNSGWNYTSKKYTDPVPPHNPRIYRPDATTIGLKYDVKAYDLHYVQIHARKDTGSGYGNWTKVSSSNEADKEYISGNLENIGDTITMEFNVGTSYQHVGSGFFENDARYQFRLKSVNYGDGESEWVYADYGNNGNVYFEDDFESGDFSAWDTANGASTESGSGNTDLGIDGPDQGSYWAYLQDDIDNDNEKIQKNLGDLSGESNVIVKCTMAVGSMDNSTEWTVIDWYDGSSWQEIVAHGSEYNKQGWVEVTALVPDSYLSTDNRVRFGGRGGLGGGDYHAFDRVIVSDILHEYTKPAAPSNLSLDNSVEGEITATWTNNASFDDYHNPFQRIYGSGDSFTKESGVYGPYEWTHTGLNDGEKYEYKIMCGIRQGRRGSINTYWNIFTSVSTATTKLPAPTSLNVSNVGPTTADLSWTDNHNYGNVEVQFKLSSGSTWTTESTLSRGTESESLASLSETSQYDARVLAKTEHTTTVDN